MRHGPACGTVAASVGRIVWAVYTVCQTLAAETPELGCELGLQA